MKLKVIIHKKKFNRSVGKMIVRLYILSSKFFPTLRSAFFFYFFSLFLTFFFSIAGIMSDSEKDGFCTEDDAEAEKRTDEEDDVQEEKRTDEEMSLDSEIKKVPPIRLPSAVWQHFEKIFDDNGVHMQTKCNYCNQKYSTKCSTTTLNDHWKSKHSKIQPGGIGSIEMAFNNFQQQQVAKLQGEEYLNLLNKFINWIITDCQPFSVVDSCSFQELLNEFNPRFRVPSRQTIRKKIDDKYTNYKNNIIKIFQVKIFKLFINYICKFY